MMVARSLAAFGRKYLPKSARRAIVRYTRWPMVGWVRFGSLRRLDPISPDWGFERGLPIDRYYIEHFLEEHAADLRGHGLEVKENLYSTRFGRDRVTGLDILHPEAGNPNATMIADLTRGHGMPSDRFDFIVLTQTLHLIYDVRAAVGTLYRILRPGGVLLATVSGISKISRGDMDRWGHHWAFTTRSAKRLFGEYFQPHNVYVRAHGNVLTSVAFLHGIASEELRRRELAYHDPDYELLITIRAAKEAGLGGRHNDVISQGERAHDGR